MLEVVNQWYFVQNVTVNSEKSQVVHLRPKAVNCTWSKNLYLDWQGISLKFQEYPQLAIVDRYKYCGLYLHEWP